MQMFFRQTILLANEYDFAEYPPDFVIDIVLPTFLFKQLKESLPKNGTNRNVYIAYEPIWSIGSGLVPKITEIAKIHRYIKDIIIKINSAYRNVKILYGGSVDKKNAEKLLKINEVDGLLIGGASLKYKKLVSILSI